MPFDPKIGLDDICLETHKITNKDLIEKVREAKEYKPGVCFVSFVGLEEYLCVIEILVNYLQQKYLEVSKSSETPGTAKRPVLYFAAAVSDFYIPYSKLPEHKIQSRDGKPKTLESDQKAAKEANSGHTQAPEHQQKEKPAYQINLQKSPKMLKKIRKIGSELIQVSFKLETDLSILEKKVFKALDEYHSNLVVGNLLQTRNREIYLYDSNSRKCKFVQLDELRRDSGDQNDENEGRRPAETLEDGIVDWITDYALSID